MTKIEELYLLKSLLHKHDLPISPILDYSIKEREEQYSFEANGISVLRENEPVFNIYKELDDYAHEFANMSVGVSKGRKLPHKAILLLGLMSLIESDTIKENRIQLDSVIANAFANVWNKYYNSKVPSVWTPFYHLKSESFWHFKPNGNEEKLKDLLSFGGTPSVGKMRPVIKYAYLDKALYELMKSDNSRQRLKNVLLDTYIYQC